MQSPDKVPTTPPMKRVEPEKPRIPKAGKPKFNIKKETAKATALRTPAPGSAGLEGADGAL